MEGSKYDSLDKCSMVSYSIQNEKVAVDMHSRKLAVVAAADGWMA